MESVSPTKNLSSEISLTLPSHPPEMSDLTNGETDHLTDPVTEVMVILYHWSQTGGFIFCPIILCVTVSIDLKKRSK